MPNSKHLTHGINNLVSLITKTKLGLSGGLQDHVKQESSRFPKPQQAGLDENEPRHASQFDL
jgi:hypothetical protein